MQEPHRSGNLKQSNKRHKTGKHRSKGEISAQFKGKHLLKHVSQKSKLIQNRNDRRNQANQLRLKKKEEVLEKKRRIGSETTPPFLITIIPLGFTTISEKLLKLIVGVDVESSVTCSQQNIFHLNIKEWKQRFSFLIPPKGDLYAMLDAVKACDSLIFLISAKNEELIDEASEKLLTCLLTQGLPSTSVVTIDLESIAPQKKHSFKQEVQKVLNRWLPNEKVITVENNGDAVALLRRIGNQKQRINFQRQIRPYLLVEDLEAENGIESDFCTLKASGYLRGQSLSCNNLVHISGWGDYQILRIDSSPDPHAMEKKFIESCEVLQVADPEKQISLESVNTPDPMDAEQTWPTEEEINDSKQFKKVIKGTSNYQACWIPEDDDFDGDTEAIVGHADDVDMAAESDDDSDQWEECNDDVTPNDDAEPEKYDKTVDFNEEIESLNKIKAAREEYAFPDEVDTPKDIPARERFNKYRGLASFRTSPWDTKENLPKDYGRIFQFENFERSRRKVVKMVDEQIDGIPSGGYLTLYIKNVPTKLAETRENSAPLVISGLLPHEHKMSVLNFVVKRTNHSCFYQLPVKSKDPVIVHCGFRRYRSQPIYSQHTNGSKHKFERFFHPNSTVVATVYAPITYPPSPVLLFTESGKGLLATGRVLSVNPDRLIIKRVTLSGHPFRVLKHSAIIRFMFFNREDIQWFKPVELRTKCGRRGHIKESLGTHGHMKAVFDDQLKSQDTVLMDLYKRVYPPWRYETDNLYSSPLYNFISLVDGQPNKNGMEICEKT